MVLRKSINILLLLLMLSMQFALAQHAAVHIFEDGIYKSSHPQKTDHHDAGKPCEMCLFAKKLSVSKPSSHDIVLTDRNVIYTLAVQTSDIAKGFGTFAAYDARGPPSLI